MKLETVWTRYQANIKAFLRTKVSNPSDVDDLLQETLIKTYQSLDTLRAKESIKPWLFQIAQHVIIDFYRRKSRPIQDLPDAPSLDEKSNDMQSELARCIEPLIKTLPPQNAELLMAIDIEGKSQKDYVKAKGISYLTLKSRVQKSRALLRDTFDACCHLSFDQHGNVVDYTPKSPNHCTDC